MPWIALLLLALGLIGLAKPVHLDDANFLALARGVQVDAWRPHAVEINWQGVSQPAFAVLSNPPGIGWWLAPVVALPVWVMHLCMLPWLALAAWGAAKLGGAIAGRREAAVVLLCASPIAVLASHALMPDLPLLACTLGGLGGLVSARRRWPWALLAGCAVLFRYSGLTLIPLAIAWPLLHGDRRSALRCGLAASLPLALLTGHDLHAYGASHLLAMIDFQGAESQPLGHKLVAAAAMLGGAAVLPVLCWGQRLGAGIGAGIGAAAGLLAGRSVGQEGGALVGTVLAAAAGGASVGGALRLRDRVDAWLLCWLVGGLLFVVQLRFVAARYWLPFFAPAVLLPLRAAPRPLVLAACLLTPPLSLALALDDLELAQAQDSLARQAAAEGTGLIAGHWGWQHHLEARGWVSLEEDAPVPPGTLLAVSESAWPQQPAPGCLEQVWRREGPDRWPGPRVHTRDGAANIHANTISAQPPLITFAPWGIGHDAMDAAVLWRGCGG